MAKRIVLSESNFVEGAVKLFRGDDWKIPARILDRVKDEESAVNITGWTMTAYLPGDTDPIALTVAIVDGPSGTISITLPKVGTPKTGDVALAESGTSLYIIASNTDGTQTLEALNQLLEVRDRGFPTG